MKELIRNGGNNNPNQLIRRDINLQKIQECYQNYFKHKNFCHELLPKLFNIYFIMYGKFFPVT